MNIKKRVLNEIQSNKIFAENLSQQNYNRAMKSEDFKSLYLQMRSLNFDISKNAFEKKNCEKLQNTLKEITSKANEVLSKLGLKFEDFEPKYACKKCKDTGYVDGKLCSCYYDKFSQILFGNLRCAVNKSHTFESADFSLFDDMEKTKKIYKTAQQWCEKLQETEYKNILLSGMTGVGKTYLTECICNKLLSCGVPVCFHTAFSLNNLFLKFHTTFDDTKPMILNDVLNVDVLVIDDLGTEPKYKNVTEEYFYLLYSERLNNNKKTIVTTNLDLSNILDKYGDRVFSRMANKKNTLFIEMQNKDLRLSKMAKK